MRILKRGVGSVRAERLGILLLFSVALACSDQENPETEDGDDKTQKVKDLTKQLFDPDHLVEVDIEIDPDDWDLIRNQGRELVESMAGCASDFEYTWVHATATIDGEILESRVPLHFFTSHIASANFQCRFWKSCLFAYLRSSYMNK